MLMPFDFAIITSAEAKQLIEFIEKSTETKKNPKNYEKIIKLGVMELYNKLTEFVYNANYYENILKNLDLED